MTTLRPSAPLLGVDVASAARLAAALARQPRLAERVFTERERRDCAGRPERWAARWAAKEAVRKLAGASGMQPLPDFRSIEVVRAESGAPSLRLDGMPLAVAVSLSHEGDLAVAVVASGPDPLAPPATPARGLVLPPRPDTGHKGTFGTVVVLAGAHGFSGAAYLSAMGAARAGAGLVRLCVPAALHPVVAVKCTEVMTHGLPEDGADDDARGVVGAAAVEALRRDHLPHADALVVGPGLGRSPVTDGAVAGLLDRLTCPTVVDADGLNIAAARRLRWHDAGQPVIVTPHPAEMARLLGTDARDVQSRRREAAAEYAAAERIVVVLKGAETVVAAPDGRVHVDPHRLVALATGGTGDVLSGVCAAMVAAGLPAWEAAVAAVSVHAEAGAAVQRERGRAGALAGDLLEALPAAQERLRRALEREAAR